MPFLSKQTAVRGPTGGGRPPVTGFYSNPWVCDICVADSVKDYSKTGKILDAGVLNNGVFGLVLRFFFCQFFRCF